MNIKYTIYAINMGGALATTEVQIHSTKIKEAIKE